MPSNKRPTQYSPELGEEICKVVASTDEGLRELCKKRSHWPWKSTITKWRGEYPAFQDQYRAAKKKRIQTIVAEAVRLTGKLDNAYITTKKGKRVINPGFVERAKLIVDSRNWQKTQLGYQSQDDKE